MPEIFLIGSPDRVFELEADENPADIFPCMSSFTVHAEARAQLYTLVTHTFLDDAMELEPLLRELTEDGPNIHQLKPSLVEQLASKDENDIEDLVDHWVQCEPIEELELDADDLNEFLFQLVHFCQTARQGEDLGVYVYVAS
jgi:hypothetical protein